MGIINPDNASVFDEGEIYTLDPGYSGTLAAAMPVPGAAPGSMWLDFGLLDVSGVEYSPEMEKTFHDGWGHPRFKGKTSKGVLGLAFIALEQNAVTSGIAYGEDAGFVSVPKGIERHLLIVTREDGVEEVEMTTRPALLTISGSWTKSEEGIRQFPIAADLMADGAGHLLTKQDQAHGEPTNWTVTIPAGTTAGTYALRVGTQTVVGIAYDATAAVLKSSLEAVAGAGNVTVTGAGPYAVKLTGGGTMSSPSAALTPTGTVTVTAA